MCKRMGAVGSKGGEAGVFQMEEKMVQDAAGEAQGLKHASAIFDNTESVK